MFADAERGIMMNKEVQDHELTETSTLESGRETSDSSFWKKLEQKRRRGARKTDSTVSEVCRRHGIGTGQFYTWKKYARQGALAALRNVLAVGDPTSKQEETLKSEMERLRVVIAELSMENLELKKGRLV